MDLQEDKKPNFLIIGAARSGTTTLVHCLRLHPEIYLYLSGSEPKFFSREQEYVKGIKYYLEKYFPDVKGYKAAGEKSTEYMENSSVAERVYQFNPNMRLICIFRNPLERTISNYWWSVFNGVENRTINEAICTELKNYSNNPLEITKLFSSRPYAYIERSIYYDRMLPFYKVFPKDNIKCIIFEEFVDNKKKIVEDIFSFLYVSKIDVTVNSIEKQRFIERKHIMDSSLFNELKQFFYEKNKKFSNLTGLNVNLYWDT